MRIVLIALLAFAAGVLAMLTVGHYRTPELNALAPAQAPAHATSASPAGAASAADAADDSDDDDNGLANWPSNGMTPEQVMYAQPQLLRQSLAGLKPRVSGKPNLYVIAFAGDGGEDVFRNEAEFSSRLFARFGPTVHTLVLENNPAALSHRPLASWSNLEAALEGVSSMMKPDEDILLLYMTTHGDHDSTLLVDMDPLPLDQIGPPDLADIFKKHPFKWKVVVVNACYSGGFVPDLRGSGTLVLTAAREDRSSFGCGSDSDITYFGKAWLANALNGTPDFIVAFNQAREQIAQWEQQDKLTPSEPQIDIGAGIAEQLAKWRHGAAEGASVPFAPAPSLPHVAAAGTDAP
ncbi:MAG TPA: C13 family peptidase [Dyella sp.]|uniref:C13 family peptidase n=1 Tax=Dyella sp. TaxID=1869338 RepID=UPI002F92874A